MNRTAPKQQRNADGKRLCRMPSCGSLVGKGRRSYCSAKCATAFEIAYFPSRTRDFVFKRDKGICAACGCDTTKLRRILMYAMRLGRYGYYPVSSIAKELGFNSCYRSGGFWQADHKTECVVGGWGTGLENIQTLCTPCHKIKTARLAAALADAKRRIGEALLSGELK